MKRDPRIEPYARLLVERCIAPEPGWQVMVRTTPLARPLVEEVVRLLARRRAYPLVRLGFQLWPTDLVWAAEAPLELVEELPDIDRYACEQMDARITIDAPENTREQAVLPSEKLAAMAKRVAPCARRTMAEEIPTVVCQFPTNALAQDAGMPLPAFADFLFDACLLDWDAEEARIARLAERFEQAGEVRIVAAATDVRFAIRGRPASVDTGHGNMPGGEFYFAPLEDSAEGTIRFGEFPAVYRGREVLGATLVFEGGRVVDARAEHGEDVLVATLETDEGARRVGELGIGCNPRITRYTRNALYDEKIDGTVHIALGASYTNIGGQNVSAVHWDLVKDLRAGGRIELDGEVVQQDGMWTI